MRSALASMIVHAKDIDRRVGSVGLLLRCPNGDGREDYVLVVERRESDTSQGAEERRRPLLIAIRQPDAGR